MLRGNLRDSSSRRSTVVAAAVVLAASVLVAARLPSTAPAQGTELAADLVLTKSDSPDPVMTDATLTYTVEVRNEGPDPATDVSMTDDFPGGVEFVSATPTTGTCERKGGKVTCTIPTLASDEVATVTIEVTVTKKKGSITNSASVQSAVADPQGANNLDTEVTQIAQPPPGPTCKGRESTIVGTEGDDAITGTDKRDVIVALGGNDTVFALSGNDTVCGGAGDDSIRGALGEDVLRGSADDDVVRGGSSDDSVGGGLGRDRLGGGVGVDVMNGGPGRDHCNGGPSKDLKRSC